MYPCAKSTSLDSSDLLGLNRWYNCRETRKVVSTNRIFSVMLNSYLTLGFYFRSQKGDVIHENASAEFYVVSSTCI